MIQQMIKVKVTDTQEKVYVCIKKCSTQTSVGIQTIQEGTDIEVDNTDPLNPIVNFDGDFIPLSGTEVGKPVTGDIEFDNEITLQNKLFSGDAEILFDNDNDFFILSKGAAHVKFDAGSINLFSNQGTYNSSLNLYEIGIAIGSDDPTSKGIFGDIYYGANYDDNTYVQKKYVDDNFAKIAPNKRLVNATTSGTFNLNHSLYSDWKLTLTGATTLTDSNLPTGDYTIEFTMKITGSFGLTLPSYWSVNGDTYDGTKWNFFAIQVHKGDVGSEEVTVFITNLA